MILKLLQFRYYRPSVSPIHQEKILAIRSELSALGIATGRSRSKRNRMSTGVEGISAEEAIDKLRAADLKFITMKNSEIHEGPGEKKIFDHNSLLLNIKVKLTKEQSNGFRGVLNLPNPELLNLRPSILFFANGDHGRIALSAGANIVGGEELISGLIEGTLPTFNRCLATTAMLPTVMKVARILGPKGLMPNTKTGTLVDSKDVAQAVKNCLQSVPFKIEKCAGLLNMSLGSLRGDNEKLKQNLEAVIEHLMKMSGTTTSKTGTNKRYIERIYLSTRAHPGIQIKL